MRSLAYWMILAILLAGCGPQPTPEPTATATDVPPTATASPSPSPTSRPTATSTVKPTAKPDPAADYADWLFATVGPLHDILNQAGNTWNTDVDRLIAAVGPALFAAENLEVDPCLQEPHNLALAHLRNLNNGLTGFRDTGDANHANQHLQTSFAAWEQVLEALVRASATCLQ